MLDNKDKKIMFEMDKNARAPLSQLAKKLRMSKQNLLYRLIKLEQKQVILQYTSIIDIHKLGLLGYRVYLRYSKINEQTEKKVINYFTKSPKVIWCASLSGPWDLEIAFGLKNFIHLSNLIKEFREEFEEHISKINVSMSVVNYHFSRDYLIDKERTDIASRHYGLEPQEITIDETDKKILRELCKNCRQNNSEIGEKIGVTYHTVKQRISKLEKSGIIQGYRALINFHLVGREYHKMLISLGKLDRREESALLEFLGSRNFVTYVVEILGEWSLEIECEVGETSQLDHLIRDLRNQFPGLIADYTTVKVLKEHTLNYFPVD